MGACIIILGLRKYVRTYVYARTRACANLKPAARRIQDKSFSRARLFA